MKLEAITAKVRPRLGWEAIDLGFGMVHQHWKALFGIWFGLTLLPFIVAVIIFSQHIEWVVILFLWLKPLFETALLHYLSRALFGEYPSIKNTLLDFRRYGFKQWFALLTWRRFSFTRPLDMPITQLENLTGDSRARRLRTLHAFNSGSVVWLTLLFLLLQFVIYINFLLLALWLIPEIYLEGIFTNIGHLFWASDSILFQSIQALLIYLVSSFFTPFYVAAGFAVYLNQRTILEAWDIELTFKRLRDRVNLQLKRYKIKPEVKKSTNGKLSSSILSASVLMLGVLLYAPLEASQSEVIAQNKTSSDSSIEQVLETIKNAPDEPNNRTEVKQQIEDVVENPPFKRKVEDSYLTFDFDLKSEKSEEQKDKEVEFDGFFALFAQLAELLLWIAVAALVIWLLIKIAQMKGFIAKPKQRKKSTAPDVLFGVELNEQSLPQQPAQSAWQLWQQGQHREALSLLLRASIVELVNSYNCEFTDGYTELECAYEVDNNSPKNISGYFRELIDIWRQYAYGHRLPSEARVKKLCDNWVSTLHQNQTSESTV